MIKVKTKLIFYYLQKFEISNNVNQIIFMYDNQKLTINEL